MKRYDLFAYADPTPLTGEWRHIGTFQAPGNDFAREVAARYLDQTAEVRVRIFTATVNSTIGRLVGEFSKPWESVRERIA